ncbi:MS Related Protein [Caenorhabditis elegans]|uniref:MS Related Protein n=1 Tax=Caenorhabditis elegans TaxID=6239 RepID=E2S7J3_CAEEL|nr:MS Related Protein [Caenorhabditis elegans]CCD72910.1 MS Related Protein [Caenorhabditis elegans]|eukprot:NP_001256078.1 Uncharacterized protein CELE_Y57E12B.10 [Caenorhabditis elegans]
MVCKMLWIAIFIAITVSAAPTDSSPSAAATSPATPTIGPAQNGLTAASPGVETTTTSASGVNLFFTLVPIALTLLK